MTPRQQIVDEYELKIAIANICFGGDITKLEKWIGEHSPEEVRMLEDAALSRRTMNFLRWLNGTDFLSSQ